MTHIPSFNNPREHLLFQRQQSRIMEQAEWENRVRPIKSGLQWTLHGFGVILFFATVFAMCFWR